ncbi:hypothetical protein N665_0163s0027 [Sinapis alba]|nr:hypothetical protein N665_0163s0027 [Sinapis alba]
MGDHNSSQASYIHLVHHLIEECIVFNMGKEECMDALFKHANIKPIITSTGVKKWLIWAVWKELEKENKEFFEAYERRREEIPTEKETARIIQDLLSRTTI